MEHVNPYANVSLQNLPEHALRPGGFELTRRLVELLEIKHGAEILDVGCGYGASAAYLSGLGYKAQGVDKSAELISRGRELYPQIMLTCAAAESLPFEAQSFGAALFECTLSIFTQSTEEVLAETRRILKSDGWLLVSDVFASSDSSKVNAPSINVRSRDGFEQILRKSGFEMIHFEDKTGVFNDFVAQVIMSTGSLDALFDCGEWSEIKKARPRYCIATARRADD